MYNVIKGIVSWTAHMHWSAKISQIWFDTFKFVICETKWCWQAGDQALFLTEAVQTTLAAKWFLTQTGAEKESEKSQKRIQLELNNINTSLGYKPNLELDMALQITVRALPEADCCCTHAVHETVPWKKIY